MYHRLARARKGDFINDTNLITVGSRGERDEDAHEARIFEALQGCSRTKVFESRELHVIGVLFGGGILEMVRDVLLIEIFLHVE